MAWSNAQAELVARMLRSQGGWLARRKLSIELEDHYWHRRRLTLDYQLLPAFETYIAARGLSSAYVPVSLLEKSPAQTLGYDLIDGGGKSTALPTLDERLALGCEVLSSMAALCISGPNRPYASAPLLPIIDAVAHRSPPYHVRRAAIISLRDLRDTGAYWLNDDDRTAFLWLATSLVDRCLLAVEQPATGDRRIIKLSFLAPHVREGVRASSPSRAGLDPFTFGLNLAAWSGRSTHVEIVAPDGLEILRSELRGVKEGDPKNASHGARPEIELYRASTSAESQPSMARSGAFAQSVVAPRGARTHLYVHAPEQATEARLTVDFRVARSGFVSAAAWVTAVIAIALLIVGAGLPSFRDHPDATGALLLALPAFGAALVTQFGAHSVTNMMLTTVRRAVYVASLLALCGCAVLLVDTNDHSGGDRRGIWGGFVSFLSDRWPWILLCLGGTWLAILAYLARQLPAASSEIRRTHRVMGRLVRPLVVLLSWPRIGQS